MTELSSTVSIRDAVFPADTATVSALLEDYLRQTEAEKADRGLAPDASSLPGRYAREVARPAESLAGTRVLIGSVGGVDCGIVVISTTDAAGSELKRFWTTPPARGHGVGTALISEALRLAARPVRLSVWEWRTPAARMYRRLGFSVAPSWDKRPELLCLELV